MIDPARRLHAKKAGMRPPRHRSHAPRSAFGARASPPRYFNRVAISFAIAFVAAFVGASSASTFSRPKS